MLRMAETSGKGGTREVETSLLHPRRLILEGADCQTNGVVA